MNDRRAASFARRVRVLVLAGALGLMAGVAGAIGHWQQTRVLYCGGDDMVASCTFGDPRPFAMVDAVAGLPWLAGTFVAVTIAVLLWRRLPIISFR